MEKGHFSIEVNRDVAIGVPKSVTIRYIMAVFQNGTDATNTDNLILHPIQYNCKFSKTVEGYKNGSVKIAVSRFRNGSIEKNYCAAKNVPGKKLRH